MKVDELLQGAREYGGSFEQGPNMDAALAAAREKLTSLVARHAARGVTLGEQQ